MDLSLKKVSLSPLIYSTLTTAAKQNHMVSLTHTNKKYECRITELQARAFVFSGKSVFLVDLGTHQQRKIFW